MRNLQTNWPGYPHQIQRAVVQLGGATGSERRPNRFRGAAAYNRQQQTPGLTVKKNHFAAVPAADTAALGGQAAMDY